MLELGFTASFATAFTPHAAAGLVPARVAVEHRGAYVLYWEGGDVAADLAGRFRHTARSRYDLPAVGDWVAISVPQDGRATIRAVLPRRTAFTRAKPGPGQTEPQVLAANVDAVFIVAALAADLAPLHRRIERYLAVARASGAEPLLVLTKADLAVDARAEARELEGLAAGVPVLVTSAVSGEGIAALRAHITPGRTVALLGPSGAGKSSLINKLLGDAILLTREVDPDGQGRHATVRRELVRIPGGGLVLDTPGLREISSWRADEGIAQTYADIAALEERCRFNDCVHHGEPGCAIAAALADGTLDQARYDAWRELEREEAYSRSRFDKRMGAEAKRRWRIHARMTRRPGWTQR